MNKDDFQIRAPGKEDAAPLLDYLRAVTAETDFLASGPDEIRITLEMEEGFIEKMNASENSVMLLACLGEAIVGVFTVEGPPQSRFRHVGSCGVSVLRKHWRRGIGSRLLEEGIAWARESGVIEKLALKVHAGNTPAIRLYEKFAFTVEGRLERDMKIGEEYCDALLMAMFVE